MRYAGNIENIEQQRQREGIDDVELREQIARLVVGDLVQVTLITGPRSFESALVEILAIEGETFRGKLARKPDSPALGKVKVRAEIAFAAAHIHSIPRLKTGGHSNGTPDVKVRPRSVRPVQQ